MSKHSHDLGAMPRLTQLVLEHDAELNKPANFPGKKFYVADSLDSLGDEVNSILSSFNLGLKTFRYFRLPRGKFKAAEPHSDSAANDCFALNLVLRGSLIVHFYDVPTTDTVIDIGPGGVRFPILKNTTVKPTESVYHQTQRIRLIDTKTIHSADTSESIEDLLLISFIPIPQYSFELASRILNNG